MMIDRKVVRLERARTRYAVKLGEELAAMIESDTTVATMRLSERDRRIAQRYRDVVQQLAGC